MSDYIQEIRHVMNVIESITNETKDNYKHSDVVLKAKEVYNADPDIQKVMNFKTFVFELNNNLDNKRQIPVFGININGEIITNEYCIWRCTNQDCDYEERINSEEDLVKHICPLCNNEMEFTYWTFED